MRAHSGSARPRNARRSTSSISPKSPSIVARVDRVDVEVTRPDLVELGPREEQADGAEQPGHGGNDDGRRAEIDREAGRVDGARAAVSDQREVARITPLLGRDRPQRTRHARVRDPVDPVRGFEHGQPERRRDALHGGLRELRGGW